MALELETERRELGDGSTLVRDRERNVLEATSGAAAVVLACARHVARLTPDAALRWWKPAITPAADGAVDVEADDGSARVPLALLQWAIEGAYAEHLGDFERWLFHVPPRACIAGQGDREAALSLETPLAQLARDVAARSLPPATEDARRQSLIAQIRVFGLLDEPMLAVKRDALRTLGCASLARWATAVLELDAYFASEPAARVSRTQPPTALGGAFSLDFPGAAPVPGDVDKHRWWAWCESQFGDGRRLAEDSGFLIASAGRTFGKLFFRTENGRRVLYAVEGALR